MSVSCLAFLYCFPLPSLDAEPKRFAFAHASDSVREPRRQDVFEPVGVPVRAQGQARARCQGRGRGPGERSPRRAFPPSLSFCCPASSFSSFQQADPADNGCFRGWRRGEGLCRLEASPTFADPLPLLPCSRRLTRSARTAGTSVCRTRTSSCVVQMKGRQRFTLCVPCTLFCSSLSEAPAWWTDTLGSLDGLVAVLGMRTPQSSEQLITVECRGGFR